jgi:hypothetical protein
MATITITIPDAIVNRVLDGMVPVIPLNAQGQPVGTKAQVAKTMLIDYMKTTVRNTEADAARAVAQADVDTDISFS